MKAFVQRTLATQTRRFLMKSGAEVVGVTGSVGKSSTKQAVGAVLSRQYRVRVSPKNYNTEFGLPFAVFGLRAPKRALEWLGTLLATTRRSLGTPKDAPAIYVLEMAADRPGDIATLCDIVRPSVGVVTAVGESHAEFFGSIENVAKEKRTLVERLPKDGVAVLNRDDARVWAMRERAKGEVIGFGFSEEADVRGVDVAVSYTADGSGECGMRFKIAAKGATVPVFLPNVFGTPSVLAALAAAAVGIAKGMNLVEISDGLRAFEPPPGRMRCIPGIKRSMLIDDTYNAAPTSVFAALAALRALPLVEDDVRFAVLGDMAELGTLSVEGHESVGRKVAELGIDNAVFVGEKMGDAERAALAAGMPRERVFHFSTPEEAGRFVQQRMKKGDAILVKGSRVMRMEKVVKELMADPLAAGSMLVESDENWKW